jgi:hypothetical protein
MYKTNKLFAKYLKVLEEQAPEGDPAAGVEPATAAASAPPAEPQEQVGNIDENEKYIIKILTNAFIFNPNKFKEDIQKYKYIFNKIDSIGKMVNVPVSEIIREIKKIIALDKSLRIESKTLKIINKYIFLLEQPADATEPQTEPSTQDTTPRQPAGGQVENSENKLNLAEIFPLYQELILKALRHTPSEEELMIIKPVVNEFADSDPEKIVETIQSILSQSLEDKEVEDNLSNA